MGTDDNKELIRRFVQEIFVEGREESVDELLHALQRAPGAIDVGCRRRINVPGD